MSLITNRKDLEFLLELNGLDDLLERGRFGHLDRETIDAILDTAQAIAEEEFLPFAARLDANEPSFDGEKVAIIPEVAQALAVYREAGFFGAGFDPELGGMGLPAMVTQATSGMFTAANQGVANYPFLTIAAANMLNTFGTDEQKARYLAPMIEGRWFGTMCLSEPHAGSSLADIRTKATPTDEGHYLIEGTKMWISGGDHELAENIVEMVLARIPGGPAGVKGISLFIVPKYRVHDDGSLGEKNNIALAGLNHKMGHRGTTNCLLNFGEDGDCHGYLVGDPHRGLQYMFHMMNEARIGVGYGAAMSALAGYLYSLEYARQRPQGRKLSNKDPQSDPVPIIEHADVRRLLLAQKAAVEGAMGLLFYCNSLIDQQKLSKDAAERDRFDTLLGILTPIAKSWPSEFCLEANKHAIQVLGGYGYTREYPVERFYRDNRLNPIHEGTHGIQGLDLLGRKILGDGAKGFDYLRAEIELAIVEAEGVEELSAQAAELRRLIGQTRATIHAVSECDDIERALSNATPFLDAFGHVVIAWQWLRQALAANRKLSGDAGKDGTEAFYTGKLAACRYFFAHELPKGEAGLILVGSLEDTCLRVGAQEFIGA